MANFYDTTGVMIGLEMHKYWVPAGPVPAPTEAGYLAAAQYWLHSAEDPATKTARLTSDGKRMIQGKCKLEYIAHWPVLVPGPPHPVAEAIELVLIIGFSSTVPVLRRQSVTGQGKPLAICCAAMIGANINCGDPVKMPTGLVVNVNSVKTSASLVDAVPAAIEWAVDSLISKLAKGLAEKFLKERLKKWIEDVIIRRYVEKIAQEMTKYLLKKGRDKVQKVLRKRGVPWV